MTKIILALFTVSLFWCSCRSTRQNQKKGDGPHLKFLSQYIVPYNYQFQNTTVGGLSGIDYDPKKNEYYFISDDRSDKNPARFYEARILISKDKIDTVIFGNTLFLKDQNGNLYPNSRQDPFHTPDPEALRLDPVNHTFIWSSEGERIVTPQKTILENPAVTLTDSNGNYIDTFILPPQLKMTALPYGPRQNGVFEGLTYSDKYKSLLVSVEEPLLQDGPRAGTGDSSGIIRMIRFDMATKKPVAEYAYKIDPVAHPPLRAGGFKINGIPDILSYGTHELLVLERSFSSGDLSCTIKVYLADLSGADNVLSLNSLKGNTAIKIIPKKLLLNMDSLGIYIDNIEGVTFGPTLADGKRSLLFIADNNFNPLEKTQLLLFEIR